MSEQRQLAADLMAELTGRLEDLTVLAISQHRAENVDPEIIGLMIDDVDAVLDIAKAAWTLAGSGER